MEKLSSAGYYTEYSDPYVRKIKVQGVIKKSKILNKKILKEFPVAIIVLITLNLITSLLQIMLKIYLTQETQSTII